MEIRDPLGVETLFFGSDAVLAGQLTRAELRGPRFHRVVQGVYAPVGVRVTHGLRCAATAMATSADAVVSGRSAAVLRGIDLARTRDPVQLIASPETRIMRRSGVDLRRTEIDGSEYVEWRGGRVATPARTALDLLLAGDLATTVADLDAVLRQGLVTREEMERLVAGRHDRGIVQARRAVELADPRAESHPESLVRVWLAEAGIVLEPQVWIHDERGTPVARVDLGDKERRVAVEYDGGWRSELWALNHDRKRLNIVHGLSWEVVFVTAPMLGDRRKIVDEVESAIRRQS